MSKCLKCPIATAAVERGLSAAVMAMEPLSDLLCVGHLGEALAARAAQQAKEAAQTAWPPCLGCGNPLFLIRPDRAICERCRLQLPKVTETVTPAAPTLATPVRELVPMPTCYGRGGTCPNRGKSYAGGSYCGTPCKPPVPYWLESRCPTHT